MSKFEKGDRISLPNDHTGIVIDALPRGRIYIWAINSKGRNGKPYEKVIDGDIDACKKIVCGPGYRFVADNEPVAQGDEIYTSYQWTGFNIYYRADRTAFVIRRRES